MFTKTKMIRERDASITGKTIEIRFLHWGKEVIFKREIFIHFKPGHSTRRHLNFSREFLFKADRHPLRHRVKWPGIIEERRGPGFPSLRLQTATAWPGLEPT